MTSERERLEQLAAEIVEGGSIDWEENTRSDDPESTRSKLASLRAVEQLREFTLSLSENDELSKGAQENEASPTSAKACRTDSVFVQLLRRLWPR